MSRRESREHGFKFLFQLEFNHDDVQELKEQFFEEMDVKDNEIEYFNTLVDGVTSQKHQLDELYSGYLKKWNLERIPKVDQTILRIATYEILHMPMVPFNVTVSEAVFLAKKYSSDESRSFINGVLSKLSSQKIEASAENAESPAIEVVSPAKKVDLSAVKVKSTAQKIASKTDSETES
jgi:N utilization substance protein B